jgi:putative colanic acid biosynthesis acetyltransferase WcaF
MTKPDAHRSAVDAPPPPDAAIFQTLDRVAANPYSRQEYIRRALWGIVQSTLIRYSLPRAYRWRRFWLRRFGAKLGPNAAVRATTRIFHPWLLEIDDWSIIGDKVVVYNLGPVSIGKHTVISEGTFLCAGTHDYTQPTMPLQRPPIRIGSGVWIAAQAFIGPGVTVGNNSIVGARAVVVSDVPEGVVVAGNPARIIKQRPL